VAAGTTSARLLRPGAAGLWPPLGLIADRVTVTGLEGTDAANLPPDPAPPLLALAIAQLLTASAGRNLGRRDE
jgi:hypothetical protein